MDERSPTRERLIDAAIERFEARGIRATSLEEVATGAGVHRVTLHRHFPGGRDELVAAVLLRSYLALARRIEPVLSELRDPAAVVTTLLVESVMFLRDDPVAAEAVATGAAWLLVEPPLANEVVPRLTRTWQAVAEATDEAGWVGVGEVGIGAVVDFVVRTVAGLAIDPRAPSGRDAVERYIATFVTPALVRPAERPH